MRLTQTDVLIVGTGAAGLYLANKLLDLNPELLITLCSKTDLQTSNTSAAQGGVAASFDAPDEAVKSHVEDTMRAGSYHNDRAAVEHIIQHSGRIIKQLGDWGVGFKQLANGQFDFHLEGGHSFPRVLHSDDQSGMRIQTTLLNRLNKHENVILLPYTFAVDLLLENDTCIGLEVLRKNGHETGGIFAGATVLTSGGIGQIYSNTSNPSIATGDGIAMAIRAGIEPKDMEFIQFHPSRTSFTKNTDNFLLTEALRGEGCRFVNSSGEYFMREVHPLKDLAPRDVVSIEIQRQFKRGNRVFLDCAGKNPESLSNAFPWIASQLRQLGIEPFSSPIPVQPAAHYCCGGIPVTLQGQTEIAGLFAAGECAFTGMHGANRLASNSLLEAAVIADNLAYNLQQNFVASSFSTLDITDSFKARKYQKVNAGEELKELHQIADDYLGIVRRGSGLAYALQCLELLEEKLLHKMGKFADAECLETLNRIQCASAVAKASLSRSESIGCFNLEF